MPGTSAQSLEGHILEGGWKVISLFTPEKYATGGTFSEGCLVRSAQGKDAFLKALDLSSALGSPDPARALQALTEAYNFERDILRQCKTHGMDRVATAIADGTVRIPGAKDGGTVPYIIFELADGDIRSHLARTSLELAWTLRALHHIATGLWQLHRRGMAHQNLKPSNVLVFSGAGSKIADLGRAAYQGHSPQHDAFTIAGDPTYAPPELLYGLVDPDWHRRRCGCDAYLLGSMTTFFYAGAALTPLLRSELPASHSWHNWRGSYQDALPYVRAAFSRVLETVRASTDKRISGDISRIVSELGEPDPALRGHPRNRKSPTTQFSLERYVTEFDLLARRAELRLWR